MQFQRKALVALIQKSPSDGSGVFSGIVAGWEIDRDNERFSRDAFDELDPALPVPVVYSHVYSDPGAEIGAAKVSITDAGLLAEGQLDLENRMAQAVYERMLLPSSDPNALSEFSVGFLFDPSLTFTGPNGERVIPKADLVEVSVVHKGASQTALLSIKQNTTCDVKTLRALQRRACEASRPQRTSKDIQRALDIELAGLL